MASEYFKNSDDRTYRISSYNCRGNYSFLEVKCSKYAREETIVLTFWKYLPIHKYIDIDIALFHAI